MKNFRRMIFGTILLIAAVLIALNSFDIINFDIFFDGWWTLFIIVPSFVDIITKRDKLSSIVCCAFGVFLLCCCQDILSFDMLWKLIVPALIAIIGIKMIISSFRKGKSAKAYEAIRRDGGEVKNISAIFSGNNVRFDDRVFDGADITACFGGVECDLSGAIIDRDCVINVCAAFGGIDIIVPDNVKIVNNATAIFGGVEVKDSVEENGPHTIYIEGIAAFGGVDIK